MSVSEFVFFRGPGKGWDFFPSFLKSCDLGTMLDSLKIYFFIFAPYSASSLLSSPLFPHFLSPPLHAPHPRSLFLHTCSERGRPPTGISRAGHVLLLESTLRASDFECLCEAMWSGWWRFSWKQNIQGQKPGLPARIVSGYIDGSNMLWGKNEIRFDNLLWRCRFGVDK